MQDGTTNVQSTRECAWPVHNSSMNPATKPTDSAERGGPKLSVRPKLRRLDQTLRNRIRAVHLKLTVPELVSQRMATPALIREIPEAGGHASGVIEPVCAGTRRHRRGAGSDAKARGNCAATASRIDPSSVQSVSRREPKGQSCAVNLELLAFVGQRPCSDGQRGGRAQGSQPGRYVHI